MILTAEKFRELWKAVPAAGWPESFDHLFEALKPDLKECLKCNGTGVEFERYIGPGRVDRFRCPDCKPERREQSRRRGLIDRRGGTRRAS